MILLYLISFIIYQSNCELIPIWNCWFHGYNGTQKTLNLLFSYNNTSDDDIPLSTASPNNQLSPAFYNGQQVDIFKTGVNYYVTLLKNVTEILITDGETISWKLDASEAAAVTSASITENNRCDIKYEGVCPMWIEGYCEDSVYCNGREPCLPSIHGQSSSHTLGQCDRPAQGVQCSPSQLCDEEVRSCIDKTPPPPPPPSIIPLFTCWFYTYEADGSSMSMNLQMAYNNTGTGVLVRSVTTVDSAPGTIPNRLSPTVYNSRQPSLFMPGYNNASFVIKDDANVLEQANGSIVWVLTDFTLRIQSSNLTPQTRCHVEGGDGGEEEEDETFIDSTASPTNGEEEGTQCSVNNTDCTMFDTYCSGTTSCDTASGNCVLNNMNHDPCSGLLQQITEEGPNLPLFLTCVEDAKICVASENCTDVSDCNDGLFCNGIKSCVNGSCFLDENVTITQLCGSPNMICVEHVGCESTNQPISTGLLIGIVAIAVAVIALLIILLYVYFWTTGRVKRSKNK